MSEINTVLGTIDTGKMGFTLCHEHVLSAFSGVYRNYPQLLDKGNLLDKAVADLSQAKAGGVKTIVDATTLDLGREPELMAEASRRSGVNIIATTGWWLDIPRQSAGISANQYADQFVREIEDGIAGTKIKAGVLKSASDIGGVKPLEAIVLRGTARAHKRTGVPIMLHSYPVGQVGKQQIAILLEEGVDLHHVKIDHCNDTTDVEYLIWLLEQGCFLGMDRSSGIVSPRARIKTLKALIDAGYADRLCPSHDRLSLYIKGDIDSGTEELKKWWKLQGMAYLKNMVFPQLRDLGVRENIIEALTKKEDIDRVVEEWRNAWKRHGFLYIKNVVLAKLGEMGVPSTVIKALCVDGPRNFFEGKVEN